MVKTIAISSGKGGVGKTSLAVNASIKLSMEGKRVALLDADFGICLLYTSPSPRDRLLSRMPSSA